MDFRANGSNRVKNFCCHYSWHIVSFVATRTKRSSASDQNTYLEIGFPGSNIITMLLKAFKAATSLIFQYEGMISI